MKTYVLHGINDLRYEDTKIPEPKSGEVLLRVSAAGICGSDIPRIYETGAHRHPLIPGHEFSGIVEDVGFGVDKKLKGKRCGVFPLIPCRKCVPCSRKKYELCRNYDYLGSRRDGAFAEYVAVPADNLIEIPDEISLETAAMLEPMAVAVHAIRRVMPHGINEGYTAAVFGVGTIGLMLISFLLDAGLSVNKLFVIGNKNFQKKAALENGVLQENFCDIRDCDPDQWLDERTGGYGADLTFDCVGKNETVIQAISHAAPSGHVLLMGNPHSDMHLERDVYWKILRHQLRVTGTWNSSFRNELDDDWHYVLSRLQRGKIRPESFITHRLSLEDLSQGFEIMRDKTEPYIKIMGVFK